MIKHERFRHWFLDIVLVSAFVVTNIHLCLPLRGFTKIHASRMDFKFLQYKISFVSQLAPLDLATFLHHWNEDHVTEQSNIKVTGINKLGTTPTYIKTRKLVRRLTTAYLIKIINIIVDTFLI